MWYFITFMYFVFLTRLDVWDIFCLVGQLFRIINNYPSIRLFLKSFWISRHSLISEGKWNFTRYIVCKMFIQCFILYTDNNRFSCACRNVLIIQWGSIPVNKVSVEQAVKMKVRLIFYFMIPFFCSCFDSLSRYKLSKIK